MASSVTMQNYLVNPNFAIRLSRSNYHLWREKSKHIIHIYNLQGFVNGSKEATPQFIKKFDIALNLIANLEFDLWDQPDTMVKSWIYGSLSYLKYLMNEETACDYWLSLQKVFLDISQANLLQLRWQLQTM